MLEGVFGHLKVYGGLNRPPVRGLARMNLYADLTVLGHLSASLVRGRAGPPTQ
jgi:hypothetical protein